MALGLADPVLSEMAGLWVLLALSVLALIVCIVCLVVLGSLWLSQHAKCAMLCLEPCQVYCVIGQIVYCATFVP